MRTIDRLCDGGELLRVKVGSRALVLRESIDGYLNAGAAPVTVTQPSTPRFAVPELEELKQRKVAAQARRAA
ncbi:MAG: hypothetical protein H0V84_09980 [Actinobacteria bacterium]|nr:hypothetical protein [Actinomycetota bacterium]